MLAWTRAHAGQWRFKTRDRMLEATFARATDTFAAGVELTGKGYGAQAAMLARSLYEDVIVAYWFTWVKDDPAWVWERLQRQALYRAHVWRKLLGDDEADELSEAELAELVKLFGAHGEIAWWKRERENVGARVRWTTRNLTDLVDAVERLARQTALVQVPGLDPEALAIAVRRLRYLSTIVNRTNNEHLHHTATGVVRTYLDSDGRRVPAPSSGDWTLVACSALHMTYEALLFLNFRRGNEALERDYLHQRRPFDSLLRELGDLSPG